MRAVATRLQESRTGEVCALRRSGSDLLAGKGFPHQLDSKLNRCCRFPSLSHPRIALDFLRADNNPLLTQKTRENLAWTPEEQSVTRWAIVRNRAPVVAGFILPSFARCQNLKRKVARIARALAWASGMPSLA